jgi:hypothetical protein
MRRSPKSNTDARRAPNVPRASVTGGHRRSLTPRRPGATTGMEAFPKLTMPCPRRVPAYPDAAIRSHRQRGSHPCHPTTAKSSRHPRDSLIVRRDRLSLSRYPSSQRVDPREASGPVDDYTLVKLDGREHAFKHGSERLVGVFSAHPGPRDERGIADIYDG